MDSLVIYRKTLEEEVNQLLSDIQFLQVIYSFLVISANKTISVQHR